MTMRSGYPRAAFHLGRSPQAGAPHRSAQIVARIIYNEASEYQIDNKIGDAPMRGANRSSFTRDMGMPPV